MLRETIINTQLALFFDGQLSKPEDLYPSLNQEMDSIFDSTPMVIPVPNDPPLNEVPIVQMNSSNGIYQCNMARGRVDFFMAGSGKQNFDDIKRDFLSKSDKYANYFNKRARVNRLGFITRFFFEDDQQDKTIAKLLRTEFTGIFKTNTTNGIHEVSIRYVSRIEHDQFEINNVTIVEKFFANVVGVRNNIKGILITRDFNTAPEKSSEYRDKFTPETIKGFLEYSMNLFKLDEINRLLWPSE